MECQLFEQSFFWNVISSKRQADVMHNHSHESSHHLENEDVKNIGTAFFLNLFFTIVEFVGGAITNSVAILSDAVHDLGDCISLGMSWHFQHISKRAGNKVYTYGYKRFSLLGAIITSVVLAIGSFLIIAKAVPRLFHPEQPDARGMLLLAVLGVIINGAAVLRLRKGHSINERVVSLHMLEDVLGWLAVLVGAVVMLFANLPILDPILSIAIAFYVLTNVYRNVKESLQIILQAAPAAIDTDDVIRIVSDIPEIESVHDVHVWSTDGQYNIMTVHVVLNKEKSLPELHELKEKIRRKLQSVGIQHVTIEFETDKEDCSMEGCCRYYSQTENL